ncbi:TonB-dependent receptor [Ferrigenium kumadai]|uniref:TonB-dependent receptor n=1 Tax=Ferrigenium kumadai TaxID=1682490 RepID=A0AAN1W0L9_9PROT|nr:TonB-dependent receptor [Ferrigenium kumadai]BBJ00609.1 TonB-dependent receptor [Ferrigenium kumadai]
MQTLHRQALYTFLVLAWAGTVAAQPSEEDDLALAYGDKSTVSIATGSRQPITRAPAVATVITSRDIEAMGAADLDQALESVPGLHVSMVHVGMNPIYSFRGIHTRYNPQVLMLVNGIPITNVFWGDRSQLWGGMPLENVARIEVIRGPGSALYGADAFSGVINVITKTAEDINGTEVGGRAGSFNSRDAWVQHGGKLGMLDAAFYLRTGNTDGQKGIVQGDALNTAGPISAGRKAVDARADLSSEAWRVRAGYQDREVGMGGGLAGSLDPNSRGHSSRTYLDLSYEQANWAKDWDISGVAGYYDNKEKGDPPYMLFPPGAIPGFPNGMIGNPGHAERHTHASISAFYNGFEQHRVRVGIGHRVEDLYQTTELKNYNAAFAPLPGLVDATGNPALVYLLPHKRNVSYAFVQDEWSLAKDWTLTAGVRHDRYSDFGGTTNPRLALVWDADYNVVVKAMHGTAFRAPSFAELYNINNPVVIGSPNLRPETITTDELAFSWQPVAALQNNLNFFRYRMRNIILPVAAVYQNAGDQTGRGLELESTFDATNNLRLTGSFSLQHSTDQATGQDAGMAPHRRLFARADWRFIPLWQVGTTINHVASRMREPGDARAKVPDYTTVDLILRREKFADGWDARAMVTNLFDRKAWEPTFRSAGMPSDLPLPRRAFYIQLQLDI